MAKTDRVGQPAEGTFGVSVATLVDELRDSEANRVCEAIRLQIRVLHVAPSVLPKPNELTQTRKPRCNLSGRASSR